MDRPNIILYLSDQQRWDTLSCAGTVKNVTPNLDRLGEEGAFFQNCFTPQPVCGPSRACIQTGRYATETDNHINGCRMPESINSIATLLKNAGYETAYFGKWHLSPERIFNSELQNDEYDVPIENRGGYEYWMAANLLEFSSEPFGGRVFDKDNKPVEFESYRPDRITDFAIQYLNQRAADRPLFMMISQLEPHHHNQTDTVAGPVGSKTTYSDIPLPEDLRYLGGNAKELFPDYLGACNALDNTVGRLESALKAAGMWNNTIFIYSSDHGCHFKTRNEQYKQSCHEASIHVPLLIHGGVFCGAGRITDMVSLVDLPATILAAANIEIPQEYRGFDLARVAQGLQKGRSSVFIQITQTEAGRAVRTREWKYCVKSPNVLDATLTKSPLEYEEEYLYDLETDPYELTNLIGKDGFDSVKNELQSILKKYITEVEHVDPVIYPYRKRSAERRYSPELTFRQCLGDPKTQPLIKKYFFFLPQEVENAIGELSMGSIGPYFAELNRSLIPTISAFFTELEKLNSCSNEQACIPGDERNNPSTEEM